MKKTLFPKYCPKCGERHRLEYVKPDTKKHLIGLRCPACSHTVVIGQKKVDSYSYVYQNDAGFGDVSIMKNAVKHEWDCEVNRKKNGDKLDKFLKKIESPVSTKGLRYFTMKDIEPYMKSEKDKN